MRRWLRVRALLLGIALAVCGCNGGGSDSSNLVISGGSTPPAGASNAVAITIDGGPSTQYVNGLFVAVTVCVHGTNHCAVLNHILVDTGSYGLRVISSEVAGLGLTPVTTGASTLGECVVFGDGSSLGTVSLVDVAIGQESISNLAVQVIGGPTGSVSRPASCGSGTAEDTLAAFGAQGVLGIGVLRYDCGAACTVAPGSGNPGTYMACSAGACQAIAWPLASQVQNPVYFLPVDKNGVAIQLAALPSLAQNSLNGVMYFGVGTQADNALPASHQQLATPGEGSADAGLVRTAYPVGTTAVPAVIDTGSNAYFFAQVSGNPVLCSSGDGFYCPNTVESFSATLSSFVSGTPNTQSFSIGNGDALFQAGFRAISDLGGDVLGGGLFDWGLPFFYGRTVFFAADGQSTPGGTGPYIAY